MPQAKEDAWVSRLANKKYKSSVFKGKVPGLDIRSIIEDIEFEKKSRLRSRHQQLINMRLIIS